MRRDALASWGDERCESIGRFFTSSIPQAATTAMSSIYKGPVWDKKCKAWRAELRGDQRTSLGYFDKEEDAAKQYDRCVLCGARRAARAERVMQRPLQDHRRRLRPQPRAAHRRGEGGD